jgi:hypothetical protein
MLIPASAPSLRAPPPARQWFALAAPAVVWSAHELSSSYLSYALCRDGRPGAARVALLGVTFAALAIALTGAVIGRRELRSLAGDSRAENREGRGREELLALASVSLAVLFTLAIVWAGLPPLLLRDLCEARE